MFEVFEDTTLRAVWRKGSAAWVRDLEVHNLRFLVIELVCQRIRTSGQLGISSSGGFYLPLLSGTEIAALSAALSYLAHSIPSSRSRSVFSRRFGASGLTGDNAIK